MVRAIRLLQPLLVLLLSGCGMTFNLAIDPPDAKLPAVTPSALHAGVYYSPEFSAQQHSRMNGPHTFVAPIGEASVKLFDRLFARTFEKVSPLSKLTPEEVSAKGVDLVIVPTLQHFDFRLGLVSDSERYSVIYRLTVHTPGGVPLASWLVPGNATDPRSVFWAGPHQGLAMMIEDDMNAAAASFLANFQREAGPALAALAATRGTRPAPLDVSQVVLTVRRAPMPRLTDEDKAALREAGIIAMEVSARSPGERKLAIRGSDMRLRVKDGAVLEPVSISSALSVLEKEQNNAMAAALFGPLVALAINAAQHQDLQSERDLQVQSIASALFSERGIGGAATETGLVLFRLPKDVKVGEGAVLTSWLVDPATAQGGQLEAELPPE